MGFVLLASPPKTFVLGEHDWKSRGSDRRHRAVAPPPTS